MTIIVISTFWKYINFQAVICTILQRSNDDNYNYASCCSCDLQQAKVSTSAPQKLPESTKMRVPRCLIIIVSLLAFSPCATFRDSSVYQGCTLERLGLDSRDVARSRLGKISQCQRLNLMSVLCSLGLSVSGLENLYVSISDIYLTLALALQSSSSQSFVIVKSFTFSLLSISIKRFC